MKKLEIIIRPSKFEEVKNALFDFGINGLNIVQVLGCGSQKGHTEYYRGQQMNINLLPKVKLEVIVESDKLEDIIELIQANAFTGQAGDGKIFVYDVVDAVRIRTNERGKKAIL